jgi:hypothetical protein
MNKKDLCGIEIKGENKWIALIHNASQKENDCLVSSAIRFHSSSIEIPKYNLVVNI